VTAVGEEQEQIAGVEVDVALAEVGLAQAADDRAAQLEALDPTAGAQDRRRQMPAGGERHPGAVLVGADARVEDGAEAPAGVELRPQRPVEQLEVLARVHEPQRRRAQRVARQRRERRGLGALAGHVADDHRPHAVGGAEGVVEVAADLVLLAGGAVARGELEAGHVGERGREQAALQRLGDVRALAVEPRVLDRERGAAGERLGEPGVVGREAAARPEMTKVSTPSGLPRLRSGTTSAERRPSSRRPRPARRPRSRVR
jgi:hypothetical protein